MTVEKKVISCFIFINRFLCEDEKKGCFPRLFSLMDDDGSYRIHALASRGCVLNEDVSFDQWERGLFA